MKRYTDLTNEELLELSENDVQFYYEIELMREGIIAVPKPQKPENVSPLEDPTIEGFLVGNLVFNTYEQALTVIDMKPRIEGYEYECGYDKEYLKAYKDDVKRKKYYAKSQILDAKEVLEEQKNRKNQYDNEVMKWRAHKDETRRIRDAIYGRINDAVEVERKYTERVQLLQHYIKIADDVNLAVAFFRDTTKLADVDIQALADKAGIDISAAFKQEEMVPESA